MEKKNEIVIFETVDSAVKLEVAVEEETVWLTQAQILTGRYSTTTWMSSFP